MACLFNFKHNNLQFGFSITETIITISILSMLAIGSVAIYTEKRGLTLLNNAQADIIYALEQAQNRAATGVGTTKHGVIIKQDRFIACEGDPCSSTTETILPFSVQTNQSNLTIIFDRLSGKPNATSTIILNNLIGTTSVTITEGGIILSE